MNGDFQMQGPNAITSVVSDGADGSNDTSTAVGNDVTWTVSSVLTSGAYELVGLTADGAPDFLGTISA